MDHFHLDLSAELQHLESLHNAPPLTMFSDQHYGIIQCKLCNKIYDDPRFLDCLHSFCCACLQTHIDQTSSPSDEFCHCPLCQEVTPLQNSANDFPRNMLLERFITQVRKDKTTVVAGKEVEKMTFELLSHEDQQCPDVRATVQQVATVAGHVIADNVQHSQEQTTTNLMSKMKNGLTLKTSQLQIRAMDLVQSIDKVNNTLQDWTDAKTDVKEMIKLRSQELQDQVKGLERKLLAQLDAREDEVSVKDEAFEKKKQLHRILRSSLSMVDFLRLLMEYGEPDEVSVYSDVITKRERKLYSGPITLKRKRYDFIRQGNMEDVLEQIFGNVTATPEEVEVWDPNKPVNKVTPETNNNDTGLEYDVETTVRSRSYTSPSLAIEREDEMESEMTDRIETETSCINSNARKHPHRPQPRTSRRVMPSKSTSFDSAYDTNVYHTHVPQSLSDKLLYGNTHEPNTEFEILNENQEPSHHKTKTRRSSKDLDPFKSAIDSLISSSKVGEPFSPRSRRCSAPPSMIIDTLNRRRLSALSILERANIKTEGLAMTTDIESGMNEARQEWMRENLKRKIDRGDSIQEIV